MVDETMKFGMIEVSAKESVMLTVPCARAVEMALCQKLRQHLLCCWVGASCKPVEGVLGGECDINKASFMEGS